MRLTRRDAIAALAVLGVGSAVLGRVDDTDPSTERIVATMVATSELVYPSSVQVDAEFVRTYLLGRRHAQERYDRAVTDAVTELDRAARRKFGQSFRSLSPDRRDVVLRALGVDRAISNPDGTTPQRIRYYLVHELLYALYTSPVGGRLLNMENPPGHPGGRDAYQRGPDQ
jgi:hypothetical protein